MQDVMSEGRDGFDVSIRDFKTRAQAFGWPFWRGVIVGFCAAFPLASIAMTGTFFGL